MDVRPPIGRRAARRHVIALQHGRAVVDAPVAQVDHARLHAAYLGEPVG